MPEPYAKIAASQAARIFTWDYDDLVDAIDSGACLSYDVGSDKCRYTCRAFVREYLKSVASGKIVQLAETTAEATDPSSTPGWKDYRDSTAFKEARGR